MAAGLQDAMALLPFFACGPVHEAAGAGAFSRSSHTHRLPWSRKQQAPIIFRLTGCRTFVQKIRFPAP
ncbi:MAG TPA: hypothetical protein VHK69_10890 [Chitinophagaceae bacterium]|nr:hypothetical protein [Chitinophagaceae bacterium]